MVCRTPPSFRVFGFSFWAVLSPAQGPLPSCAGGGSRGGSPPRSLGQTASAPMAAWYQGRRSVRSSALVAWLARAFSGVRTFVPQLFRRPFRFPVPSGGGLRWIRPHRSSSRGPHLVCRLHGRPCGGSGFPRSRVPPPPFSPLLSPVLPSGGSSAIRGLASLPSLPPSSPRVGRLLFVVGFPPPPSPSSLPLLLLDAVKGRPWSSLTAGRPPVDRRVGLLRKHGLRSTAKATRARPLVKALGGRRQWPL